MLLIWAGSDNRTLRSTQQLLNTKVNHFKVKVKNFNSTMVRLKASANVQEQGCDLLTILYF